MKRLLSVLLALALIFTVLFPYKTAEAATGKLNVTVLNLKEGDSYTLKLIGTKGKITWKSSNNTIAVVSSNGTISAKNKGKATITATVNKKMYSCKLTVTEGFDAKKAVANIDTTVSDMGNGLIVQFKNNYSLAINMTVNVVYYDANGTIVGTAEDDNYYFESGKECAIRLSGPYNSDYEDIQYSSYKLKLSAEPAPSWMKSMVPYLSAEGSFGSDNLIVTVSNSGKDNLDTVALAVVYYKDGKVIGFDSGYAKPDAGGKDYVQFMFPYDSNYETIHPSDFKVYINHCYR